MSVALNLRSAVFARDGGRCRYCGCYPKGKNRHVDHVIPRSKGGPDSYENLVTACARCNIAKRDNFLSFSRLLEVAPNLRWEAHYPEVGYVCSTCGGVVEHGGDSFCLCASRRHREEEERTCECGEEKEEWDELCRRCHDNLYVYCWDCGVEEMVEGSDYCAECAADHPVFRGGVG